MVERFSLKDHLFNAETVARAASDYARGVPGFNAEKWQEAVLTGFPERELLERIEWMADCLEPYLPANFNEMANVLEASLPPELDPSLSDNDFGHFIHAVPGVLAVRHGLETHRDRALDLLHAATKRFSMEFYIRPFLNRWPDETLTRLTTWTEDDHYHVRRLVSEGTRPRLPWASAVTLLPDQTMPFLDKLHADPTRFVTRSVANHLNDLTRIAPGLVLDALETWKSKGRQQVRELDWMRRHALRTLIKSGDSRAMSSLGYDPDASVRAVLSIQTRTARIGEFLAFSATLSARKRTTVLVDYMIDFPASAEGKRRRKVFKLKQDLIRPEKPLVLSKRHRLKGGASTFTLRPGTHKLILQVNGRECAEMEFTLIA